MKDKVLLLVLCTLCLSACRNTDQGTCEEQIKTFYTAYITNVLHESSKNDSLCKTYMTKAMQAKRHRQSLAINADPVIRAQDTNTDAIKTLKVQHLTHNWYMVSYLWNLHDSTSTIQIPIQVAPTKGRYLIAYITPTWSGTQYGDQLLSTALQAPQAIKQSSEQAFLESFYKTYTSIYCTMPIDLEERLATLRTQHLSPRALTQFDHASSEYLKDYLDGYDLLIHDFDFDAMWYTTIQCTPSRSHTYQITYTAGDIHRKVTVSLTKRGTEYEIDRFIL